MSHLTLLKELVGSYQKNIKIKFNIQVIGKIIQTYMVMKKNIPIPIQKINLFFGHKENKLAGDLLLGAELH